MKRSCDCCGKNSKEVGKLFRVGYLTLCKKCRTDKKCLRQR
jgi:hypothetical protein